MKKYSIRVLWGTEHTNPKYEPAINYLFDTETEYDAFLLGIAQLNSGHSTPSFNTKEAQDAFNAGTNARGSWAQYEVVGLRKGVAL